MKRIIAYKCEYCGKVLKTKWGMLKHENTCLKNPVGKNCFMCKQSEIKDIVADYDEETIVKDVPTCPWSYRIDWNMAPSCEHFERTDTIIYQRRILEDE
jgi:hypothetical protein